MQILQISPSEDREQWLDMKRTIITSTRAKDVRPLARGGGLPQGIYELLAGYVAIAKDGESERDRGLRLEREGMRITAEKYHLTDYTDAPGMWLSDDGLMGVTPDGAQKGDAPTYALENKSLDTKNHLQVILNDLKAKKQPHYNPIDSLVVSTSDFRPQARQYFVINEKLQTLYFSLYDDRVALENVVHYVIKIERHHVQPELEAQELYERDAIATVKEMIEILKGVKG